MTKDAGPRSRPQENHAAALSWCRDEAPATGSTKGSRRRRSLRP